MFLNFPGLSTGLAGAGRSPKSSESWNGRVGSSGGDILSDLISFVLLSAGMGDFGAGECIVEPTVILVDRCGLFHNSSVETL